LTIKEFPFLRSGFTFFGVMSTAEKGDDEESERFSTA